MRPGRKIVNPTGDRRAVVYAHEKGFFSFEGEFWDAEEECWIPSSTVGFPMCDTMETALVEAIDRIPWLTEELAFASGS
ncbi:MAG: hypothetical protein JNM34_01090 [Chthonomonadaceae bacterium]|nr:hypothetical protein [Chthonomonadaceae bacterium]